MKKVILSFFGIALTAMAIAQELAFNSVSENRFTEEVAVFNWAATVYDFGQIKAGVPVTHEFSFTNTGNIPLVVTSVQASCGCTVTSYSKEPIAPGASGFVSATYNAAKVGQFTKPITVIANTDESAVQLTIKGEVVE
jgi:hypothetical protein